jgi:hypothetical protein
MSGPDLRRLFADDGNSFRSDTRGVSPLVGFILLFGILVATFAAYQVNVVPQQNAEVEFEHSVTLDSDMQELRSTLLTTGITDEDIRQSRSVQVQLGTQYPSRIIAVNPPPAQGQLQTEPGNVSISGATVTDPEPFRGSPNDTLLGVQHETRHIRYSPSYREIDNPSDRVIEHSLLYNANEQSNVSVTDQQIVQNSSRSIDLVLIDGEIDTNGFSTSVDIEALDGPTAQVPIGATSGNTFNITLSTDAPTVWQSNQTIGETFDQGEPNARATQTGPEEVTITVDDSISGDWTLQMTKVGVGGSGESDDNFSSIRRVDPRGPLVEIDSFDDPVTAGNNISIAGRADSTGNDTLNRTGTPIQKITANPENHSAQVLFEENPDNDTATDRNFSFDSDTDATVEPIQTDGTWNGDETITIRAQDASGRESVIDRAEITVTVNP